MLFPFYVLAGLNIFFYLWYLSVCVCVCVFNAFMCTATTACTIFSRPYERSHYWYSVASICRHHLYGMYCG